MPLVNVRNNNQYRLILTGQALMDAINNAAPIMVVEIQNESVGGVGNDSVIDIPTGIPIEE